MTLQVAWLCVVFWVSNWNCWEKLSNNKRSSGVITGGFGDDFIDCLLNADVLFGKNIPFDTLSYINENNMYAMAKD